MGWLALSLIATPVRAAAESEFPTELQQVDRIRFEGRHHVAEKELRAAMKTQTPSVLPWRDRPVLRLDFLRADTAAIVAVYRQYGYLDAQAGVQVRSMKPVGHAELMYRIREGERTYTGAVEFSGVHAVPEGLLRQKIYTRRGRPFNPSALIVDTLRIAEVYQDRGYIPRVTADTLRRANSVTVRYQVTEGPVYHFGAVYYSSTGELRTRRWLIERMLDMHSGDLYRRSRIQRSVEHLYSTDLFRSIQVTPLPDSTNSLMEISMRLEERKRRWIDAGIGSGTTERFSVNGSWGHRNFSGQGVAASVGSRLSFDQDAKFLLWRSELSLRSPVLFGIRASSQATGYYYEADDRDPRFRWVIHQRGPGVRLQVQREFSRTVKLTATQDNAWVNQHIHLITASVNDTLVPSYYTTHLLNLSLDRDERDDPLVTTHGSFQTVSGEIAGGPLAGSSSYSKGQTAAGWYAPVASNRVFAVQIRAGAAAPFGSAVLFTPEDATVPANVARVPLENRFRLGGVNSVRGFSENSLAPNGGLAMIQVNAELRVALLGPFGVEFYIDGGNVWEGAGDIHIKDFTPYAGNRTVSPGDMRYVYGFGPRLNLPFGPLRLDYTWSPRPVDPVTQKRFRGRYQFAIGPSF